MARGQRVGRETGVVSRESSCSREVFLCGSSPLGVEGGWVLDLELQAEQEGQGPRKDHSRRPQGLGLQAREAEGGGRTAPRTEEGRGWVARKRKRGGWDLG